MFTIFLSLFSTTLSHNFNAWLKINERRSSLVRTHPAIFVYSSSLRPTKDENRMVCAGLNIADGTLCGVSYVRMYNRAIQYWEMVVIGLLPEADGLKGHCIEFGVV